MDSSDVRADPKLEKDVAEHEQVMNMLHTNVHSKMSLPQRQAHGKSVEAELPRACRDVCKLYPDHATTISPYYASPKMHACPPPAVKKSSAERLVFANAYVHTMHKEMAKCMPHPEGGNNKRK